jgi:hypothetical protein
MATASASLLVQVDEPDLGRGIGRDMRAASHSREKEARVVAQRHASGRKRNQKASGESIECHELHS